jgi:hypothetical protein
VSTDFALRVPVFVYLSTFKFCLERADREIMRRIKAAIYGYGGAGAASLAAFSLHPCEHHAASIAFVWLIAAIYYRSIALGARAIAAARRQAAADAEALVNFSGES